MFGGLCTALALFAATRGAAVTMSASPAAPAIGVNDQFNLTDDQAIPGGNTPGGGTYNSQAYSDNGGPPGQTFTTPNSAASYALTAISLKGTGDCGGGSTGGNWGLRISQVGGTTLTPLSTVTGIVGPASAGGDDWVTWSLSGVDVLTLAGGTQYAFEVYSNNGWYGFGGALDAAYAGGTAFNNAGNSRTFNDASLGNLANHGYDRTFVVALSPVPEPATLGLVACGALGLLARRRR